MTTLDLFKWQPPAAPPKAAETLPAPAHGLRDYQHRAASVGVDFLNRAKEGRHGVIVLPTGAGKSHVIGKISSEAGRVCVLQPSKEILEQNYRKITATGAKDVGIYSASFGSKAVKRITCATIGSIYKRPDLFAEFDCFIVDECDIVNPEDGMYKNFFDAVGKPVLGLTASPWRLTSGGKIGERRIRGGKSIPIFAGSRNTIITRSKPRFFTDIIHITQIGELYKRGYLCPLNYIEGTFDDSQLALNKTGNDFTDASFKRISSHVVRDAFYAVRSTPAKHHLVFAKRIEDAHRIADQLNNIGITSAVVTGETKTHIRDSILRRFMAGQIDCVVNVEVLTVGFDFPELDHIVMARPTASARLYYQMLGRGIRTHAGKESCTLTDLVGNVNRFGRIEDWILEDPENNGKWRLKSGDRYLTGVDLKTGDDLEIPKEVTYTNRPAFEGKEVWKHGKYKDYPLEVVPDWYLRQIAINNSLTAHGGTARKELERRGLPV